VRNTFFLPCPGNLPRDDGGREDGANRRPLACPAKCGLGGAVRGDAFRGEAEGLVVWSGSLAHAADSVVPSGILKSLIPSRWKGVVKYWAATGALSRQTRSGTLPCRMRGSVNTKNWVTMSRANQMESTLAESPALFFFSSVSLSDEPNILANAASFRRHIPMFANVLQRRTGVAGEWPRAFAMLSTVLAEA